MSPRPHTQLGKARELGNPRKRADNVHDVDSARPGLAGWITQPKPHSPAIIIDCNNNTFAPTCTQSGVPRQTTA